MTQEVYTFHEGDLVKHSQHHGKDNGIVVEANSDKTKIRVHWIGTKHGARAEEDPSKLEIQTKSTSGSRIVVNASSIKYNPSTDIFTGDKKKEKKWKMPMGSNERETIQHIVMTVCVVLLFGWMSYLYKSCHETDVRAIMNCVKTTSKPLECKEVLNK